MTIIETILGILGQLTSLVQLFEVIVDILRALGLIV